MEPPGFGGAATGCASFQSLPNYTLKVGFFTQLVQLVDSVTGPYSRYVLDLGKNVVHVHKFASGTKYYGFFARIFQRIVCLKHCRVRCHLSNTESTKFGSSLSTNLPYLR